MSNLLSLKTTQLFHAAWVIPDLSQRDIFHLFLPKKREIEGIHYHNYTYICSIILLLLYLICSTYNNQQSIIKI